MPSRPDLVYAPQWVSWEDWLGVTVTVIVTPQQQQQQVQRAPRLPAPPTRVPLLAAEEAAAAGGYTAAAGGYTAAAVAGGYTAAAAAAAERPKPTDRRRRRAPQLTLSEAREVVRVLGLRSSYEWAQLCRDGRRPPGVCGTPFAARPWFFLFLRWFVRGRVVSKDTRGCAGMVVSTERA